MALLVGSVIAAYLVLTLTATGLAKLTRLAGFASSLARDLPISYRWARTVAVAVCAAELLLAAAVVTRIAPVLTATTLVVMLNGFTGYRVWVFARTRSAVCWCAGQLRAVKSSRRAMVSAGTANMTLAGLAVAWAVVTRTAGPASSGWAWVAATGAVPPAFAYAVAKLRRTRAIRAGGV
jgi:hypothetical protein